LGRFLDFSRDAQAIPNGPMVAEWPELAFRHREPIVSESNPTIRRTEING
jgi:hypothetical protein